MLQEIGFRCLKQELLNCGLLNSYPLAEKLYFSDEDSYLGGNLAVEYRHQKMSLERAKELRKIFTVSEKLTFFSF